MFRTEARQKITDELARGAEARAAGLEGRARVCARRAAGAAVREYLALRGEMPPAPGALDLLDYLRGQAGLAAAVYQALDHLLLRVDETYALPAEIDLLDDAERLVALLDQTGGGAGREPG